MQRRLLSLHSAEKENVTYAADSQGQCGADRWPRHSHGLPSLTGMAAESLQWFRILRASLMAFTCFQGEVTFLDWEVGADMLQTTVPRKSRLCNHILLRTLAFLSEYWVHWQKSSYIHS